MAKKKIESGLVTGTETDIGAEIVEATGEPTKTVEEMKQLMGEVETPETNTETAPQSEGVPIPDLSSAFTAAPNPESQPQTEPVQESKPEEFNPDIHCVDNFGNPVRTKNGSFRRKPGRKTGNQPGTEPKPASKYENFTCSAPVSTMQIVGVGIDSMVLICSKMMGDDWKFASDSERQLLLETYSRYIHYRGWDSAASPEAVVIGVTCAYLLPRLMSESFIKKVMEWTGKGKTNGTYVNIGPNGKRKNDTGKGNSPASGTERNASNNSRPVEFSGLGGTIDISELRRKDAQNRNK